MLLGERRGGRSPCNWKPQILRKASVGDANLDSPGPPGCWPDRPCGSPRDAARSERQMFGRVSTLFSPGGDTISCVSWHRANGEVCTERSTKKRGHQGWRHLSAESNPESSHVTDVFYMLTVIVETGTVQVTGFASCSAHEGHVDTFDLKPLVVEFEKTGRCGFGCLLNTTRLWLVSAEAFACPFSPSFEACTENSGGIETSRGLRTLSTQRPH